MNQKIKQYWHTYLLGILLIGIVVSSFSPKNNVSNKNLGNGPLEDTLAKHFKNPPPEYSLLPFWSLNNTLDTAKLNWQMDQMLDKGVYGAFMHAREGLDQSATPYFSDGWWKAIESTVKHAHDIGFYTYLYDEDKWPSGSAGGRTIKVNPERNVKKILRYNDFQVLGPQSIQLNFANNPLAIFAGKTSDRGVYDYSSQVDLTAMQGKEWKVPAGRWSVISFTQINDPENQINYMDSATVADFLHITHDEYYKRLGPYFGNTIPGVFFDEIYANSRDRRNNIFWSDNFAEQFKKSKGYDLKPYLPLMIYNDPTISPLKRYDFFDVVRNVYGSAWFTQYSKWAADHHIWVTGHTTEEMIQYIRQSDYFYTMGQLQVPCTDNEDFRYGFPREIDWYNPKQISSIGHNYGKTRMAAESMGSGGYTIPLEEYRYGFSMLGVYGVNMFIPHLFHYSMDRPENQADWPPSWFYQNPYWKYFKPLANYAQRISYMVSQGDHVCKVALAYPLTQVWLGGYASPVDDDDFREVQRILIDNHIDYDVIDPYTLSTAVSDSNGLKVGREQYKVLILPALKAIQAKCMERVNDFIAKGGVVVGLKELPAASEKGTPVDPDVVASVTNIFGFESRELSQVQYHNWDKDKKNRFSIHKNAAGGKGIFTRFVETLPEIIHQQVTPDILVYGEGNEWLKYQHRKVANREVYYFVNSHRQPNSFKVSFQQLGKPQSWNPETGAISEINNYRVMDNRLELQLDFKPWESYFIVIEPGTAIRNEEVLVQYSDLEDMEVMQNGNTVSVTGWSDGNNHHQVSFLNGNETETKKWQGAASLPEIPIKGNWGFQVCPAALNYKWSSTISTDTLELPVMKFKAAFNNVWKDIKVEDPFSGLKGCIRYLGSWDADWINYYDYSMHLPELGGGVVYFRKNILIDEVLNGASLDITADESYELLINGKLVGKNSNWKVPVHYVVSDFFTKGSNTILVKTTNTKGLLMQGSLNLQSGKTISFNTDDSWQASKDKVNWLPAFLHAAPPLGSWGNIVRPDHSVQFPCTVAYQQALPPGTEAVIKPLISGQYEIFVNDHLLQFIDGKPVNIRQLLKGENNTLSIRVKVNNYEEGLLKPVKLICGRATEALGSWTEKQLSWYSGRVLYTHSVQIEKEYCKPGTKLMLDLGQVNHFAEIWVNDQLVCYRSWAPFIADISKFIHPGENKITIVVANLLANQASWNLIDANIDNKDARWWNFGSIMREKENLVSGLMGPVKIIPMQKQSIQLSIKQK